MIATEPKLKRLRGLNKGRSVRYLVSHGGDLFVAGRGVCGAGDVGDVGVMEHSRNKEACG